MMDNDKYFAQLSVEQIEKNTEMVLSLASMFPEPRRAQVKKMLDGELGERFFLAPASSRRAYHSAFPGGLVAHSLGVVRNSLSISKALAPKRFPDHKLVLCSLFHDLGKAVSYSRTTEEWKWRRGEYWDTAENERMQSGEGSLYLLQKHGVELDYDETMAIRLTDGPQDFHLFREPPLSLIVGWADRWAMLEEKEADR